MAIEPIQCCFDQTRSFQTLSVEREGEGEGGEGLSKSDCSHSQLAR